MVPVSIGKIGRLNAVKPYEGVEIVAPPISNVSNYINVRGQL
jgi:hypothetical protein